MATQEEHTYGRLSFWIGVVFWVGLVTLGFYTSYTIAWWLAPFVYVPFMGKKCNLFKAQKITLTPQQLTFQNFINSKNQKDIVILNDVQYAEMDIIECSYWYVPDDAYYRARRDYYQLTLNMIDGSVRHVKLMGFRWYENSRFQRQLDKYIEVKRIILYPWEM